MTTVPTGHVCFTIHYGSTSYTPNVTTDFTPLTLVYLSFLPRRFTSRGLFGLIDTVYVLVLTLSVTVSLFEVRLSLLVLFLEIDDESTVPPFGMSTV